MSTAKASKALEAIAAEIRQCEALLGSGGGGGGDAAAIAARTRRPAAGFEAPAASHSALSAQPAHATPQSTFVERLSQSKRTAWSMREQQKQRSEEAEVESATFQPRLSMDRTRRSLEARDEGQLRQTADRLHHEADDRLATRQRLRRELETQELRRLQFVPQVNHDQQQGAGDAGSGSRRRRPLHERVGELQRERAELMQRLRDERDRGSESSELTFEPRVSHATRKIVAARASAEESGRRTAQQEAVDASRQRRVERVLAEQRKQAESITFKPATNPISADLANRNPSVTQHQNFLQRVKHYEERRHAQQKQMEETAEDEQALEAPHRPEVPARSQQLVAARASRRGERGLDKVVRLAYGDQQHKAAVQEIAEAEFYAQFKYQPTVNRCDHARPTTLDDLVTDERAESARQKLRAEAETAFREECTFKPSIDQVSKRLAQMSQPGRAVDFANTKTISKAISRSRAELDQRIEQCRASLESERLKPCTFAPKVNHQKPASSRGRRNSAPVVVRGLGRHLELQESAHRLRKEQRERERKAFNVGAKVLRRREGLYTVPQPFALSTSKRKDDRDRRNRQTVQTLLEN